MSKISDWIAAFKAAEANDGNITAQPEKKPELKAAAETAATEASTEISQQSYCGDTLTWNLEHSVLTISGTGIMYDYWERCSDPLAVLGLAPEDDGVWYTNYPWYMMHYIKEIVIQEGVTRIGDYAFNCNFYLGDPEDSHSELIEIRLPESLSEIGQWAFSDCDKLSDIYYSGTEEKWKAIDIARGNEWLLNATIHYNSDTVTD